MAWKFRKSLSAAGEFAQGGLASEAPDGLGDPRDGPLRSLATIGFEPVWIFTHALNLNDGLATLIGKRVAVGLAGSGNRKVAIDLLKTYGVVNHNRLYRRYGELKFLERDIATRTLSPGETESAREQLDSIEREVIETRFPLDFSDRVHVVQQHVDYVRAKLAHPAPVPGRPEA